MYLSRKIHLCLGIFTGLSATLWAQTPPAAEPPKEPAKKEEPKKDPKVEEYEKAIKDLTKSEGFLTIYRRKRELLVELSEADFGRTFYAQASMNTGVNPFLQSGFPVGDTAIESFRIEKSGDDRVILWRKNTKFRWAPTSPWAVVSKRSFPEAQLAELRIEATHPEKKTYLVNLTPFFTGDPFRLNEAMGFSLGRQYVLSREDMDVRSLRNTPDNLIVQMHLPYISPGGAPPEGGFFSFFSMPNQLENPRSAPIQVTFNLYAPPKHAYKPRLSDPRIGYFEHEFTDIDNRYLKPDRQTRYIMRWNFGGKKNPSERLSEPNRPMVWVIDNSIPPQYREACRMGVLGWNKAFEKIGYKNALQVVDAPENDPNYDHADNTRNVLRWTITNGNDGAIALFRTDPMTGEILNTSVNFDASWVPYGIREFEDQGLPASTIDAKQAAKLMVLASKPEECDQIFNYAWGNADPKDDARAAIANSLNWQHHSCRHSSERAKRIPAEIAALKSAPGGMKISIKEYLDHAIANTVAHEVGHCLGLRHNFVSSTNLTVAELAKDSLVWDQGVASSLMDYTPANNVALLNGKGVFYTWDPGLYDYLAVRYGYQDIAGTKPEDELPVLRQIAAQTTQRGLEYMSDEDADSFDPTVLRWDLGRDMLAYLDTELKIARRMRAYALQNLPKANEPLSTRNDMILRSMSGTFRAGSMATRFLGGLKGTRSGSLKPTDAATQRTAMKLIARECLSMKAIDLPENVLQSMSKNPATSEHVGWTAPLRSIISGQQEMILSSVLRNSVGGRILENEFKTKSTLPYTLAEHYNLAINAVFEDMKPGQMIPPLRRDLQRAAVDLLINQVSGGAVKGTEIETTASDALRTIQELASKAIAKSNHKPTTLHLRQIQEDIRMFFNRVQTTGGGSGFSFPFFKTPRG